MWNEEDMCVGLSGFYSEGPDVGDADHSGRFGAILISFIR